MTVNPVSLAGPLVQPAVEAATHHAGAGGMSFSSVVDRVLGSAGQSHLQAEAAVNNLALGRTDNVHEVLLQVARADLSFRLILEIRNRLTEAYQDVMKMQV